MVVSVLGNIQVYVCSPSRQRVKSEQVVLTYICECVCTLETRIHSSGIRVCSTSIERVCMYEGGEVEVHEKLSSLNDGKHVNFVRTNMFSLTISSSMFGCGASVKLSRAVARWES